MASFVLIGVNLGIDVLRLFRSSSFSCLRLEGTVGVDDPSAFSSEDESSPPSLLLRLFTLFEGGRGGEDDSVIFDVRGDKLVEFEGGY